MQIRFCTFLQTCTILHGINNLFPQKPELRRVLDAKRIIFLHIDSDMYYLLHMRYFALSSNMSVLPAHLSKLWNIQHLVGKAGKGGEKIQSFETIYPESCTKELSNMARNLKKLRIGGKDCRHESLPPYNKFPPTLKSLTLAGTYLDWSQMSILALLEKLEVLKLKNKAFMGRIWETEDGDLRTLKLRNYSQLQEVPIELARIPNLTLLDLYEPHLAASCANRFIEEKEMFLKSEDVFKLSIYPPFL
ncbi:hypothetical protein SASPL_145031 [Salvia splendens]|uniref:Disease resistance protein RPM1 n=1 Tax=Salvia splendens TaxID=180675 RepID=A0A8X8WGE1_SALSN|nr:hypothetical protein SASPL_145031 [Salvia splendens]